MCTGVEGKKTQGEEKVEPVLLNIRRERLKPEAKTKRSPAGKA